MYGDKQTKWKNPDPPAKESTEGTLSTLLEALQPFPEARAAIIAAFRRKLGLVEPTE